MTCEHSLAEKEAACADGMCPFCAAARAELAQIEVTRLRDLADSMGQDNIMAQIELEQLRRDHVAMLDRCTSRCVKLKDDNERLKSRIVTLEGMLGEVNIAVPE